MYGADAATDVFYYLTLYNENYPMPARARPASRDEDILEGLYRWAPAPDGLDPRATILFSGSAQGAAREAQAELAEHYGVGAELWSATSYKAPARGGPGGRALEPPAPRAEPPRSPLVDRAARPTRRARSSP